MPEERLQKLLAHAGIASRRKAEQMIVDGQVMVNGSIITELGTKADLSRDHIKVNGKYLRAFEKPVYIVLNKPDGTVTTASDPERRPTVMDLVRGVKARIYPVGRLDYHTEGLLLLTNDGEFANRITSAAYHVEKTYLAKVNGPLTTEQEERFRAGLPIGGHRTAPAGLKMVKRAANPWYEVRLIEGRQNQIRIMFKSLGRLVEKLKRTRIAFLDIGPLRPGKFRPLTETEIRRFRKLLKIPEE
ncbi:MAG: rRNA pseudouridine synthase [Acidobacteriota bacterium]|nr:rRNA pseudouridine synthase [Acidobacteriota bacterium]